MIFFIFIYVTNNTEPSLLGEKPLLPVCIYEPTEIAGLKMLVLLCARQCSKHLVALERVNKSDCMFSSDKCSRGFFMSYDIVVVRLILHMTN